MTNQQIARRMARRMARLRKAILADLAKREAEAAKQKGDARG